MGMVVRSDAGTGVPTPCIGVCSATTLGDPVCRGCKRFAGEVLAWSGYGDAEKRSVERRLQALLLRSSRAKFRVRDPKQLRAYLRGRGLGRSLHRPPLCWVHELWRDVKVESLDGTGVEPLLPWCDYPVRTVLDALHMDFLRLSQAYAQRRSRRGGTRAALVTAD